MKKDINKDPIRITEHDPETPTPPDLKTFFKDNLCRLYICNFQKPPLVYKNFSKYRPPDYLDKKWIYCIVRLMGKRLNDNQKRYVKKRLEGKKPAKAVLESYPNVTTYSSAAAMGTYNENNPKIRQALDNALAKYNLTEDKIAATLADGLEAKKSIYDVKTNTLIESTSKDYNTIHKYLSTLIDVKGLKATEKKSVEFKGIMALIDETKLAEIRRRFN